jgi:uncharacterized tellurite resistance protein B-like protein
VEYFGEQIQKVARGTIKGETMKIGEGLFDFEKGGEPTQQDFKTAVVLLLVIAGVRDEVFVPEELTKICEIATAHLGLNSTEVAHYIEVANYCIAEEETANRILERVRDRFSDAQRHKLVSLVREVVMSDGLLSSEEQQFLGVVGEYLGIDE